MAQMEQTIENSFERIRKRIAEEKQRAGQHLAAETVEADGRLTRRAWTTAKPDVTDADTTGESVPPRDLAEHCRLRSKALLDAVRGVEKKDYLAASGLLKILDRAVELASTEEQREQVATFVSRLTRMVVGSPEEHQKQRCLAALAGADPGLFFPFCRGAAMPPEEGARFYAALREELNGRIPGRTGVVEQLSTFAARRMIGDRSTRTPLLHGPPGAGKSELANQFAAAATAVGLPTAAVFQSLTQEGTRQEQTDMALLGSSLHYNNGTTGLVYDTVSDPALRLGVVVLDEADKTNNRDYLVGLLDPKNPLQDHFVREVMPAQDMRHKCLFILTANDTTRLGEGTADPLWSRLDPLHLRPYERDELVDLGTMALTRSVNTPYCPSIDLARSVIREALDELGDGANFRAILDLANQKLFYELLLSTGTVNQRPGRQAPPVAAPVSRRAIGFQI